MVYANDEYHFFFFSMAEDEYNGFESGTVYYIDGRTEEFKEGNPQGIIIPGNNQNNTDEDDDSSVATFTE